MPRGFARITRIGPAPSTTYGYTWKILDDSEQDVDSFDSGNTLTQAYNEVGVLFQALTGTIREASISVGFSGAVYTGALWRTVTNGNYALRWKTTGPNYATTVTGRTLAQAYSDIGALIPLNSTTVVFVEIEGEST